MLYITPLPQEKRIGWFLLIPAVVLPMLMVTENMLLKGASIKHLYPTSECRLMGDADILMHPRVWEASGHVASFSDPLLDCKECKMRHRADNLIEGFNPDAHADGMTKEEMFQYIQENQIPCPKCGKSMFKKSGKGRMKPFCINENCENFLPEDKRGYYKKPAANPEEAPAQEQESEKKPAAKKAATKKTAAKKTTAKKTTEKKTTTRKKKEAAQ